MDLLTKKIFWVNEAGLSLVVADCRVLLSYALSNNSVLMAWANESLDPEVGVEPVDGLEALYTDCDPHDVWALSTKVGEAVGAEALYKAPSPQSWVMLGLWNLRPGGAEQFHSGSPREYVLTVLEKLRAHIEFDDLALLMDNYAESFLQLADHPHKSGPFETPLRDTARGMRNLLVHANPGQKDKLQSGLSKLRNLWPAS